MEFTKKSLRIRNWCGALLGGILGIIAFAAIPWLLPLGCLVGVTIGWWFDVLIQLVWRRTRQTAISQFLHLLSFQTKYHLVEAPGVILLVLGYCVVIGSCYLGLFWVGPAVPKPFVAFVFLFPMFVFFPSLIAAFLVAGERVHPVIYRLSGETFVREASKRLWYHFRLLLASVFTGIFCTIGVVIAIGLLIPLACVGLLWWCGKSVWLLCTRQQHVCCLVVTMTVTCGSAWIFQPSLSQAWVLWSVALVTGVLSGMIVEVVGLLEPFLRRYFAPVASIGKHCKSGFSFLSDVTDDLCEFLPINFVSFR